MSMWDQLKGEADKELKKEARGKSSPVTTTHLSPEELEELRGRSLKQQDTVFDRLVESPFEHTDVEGTPVKEDKPFGRKRKS